MAAGVHTTIMESKFETKLPTNTFLCLRTVIMTEDCVHQTVVRISGACTLFANLLLYLLIIRVLNIRSFSIQTVHRTHVKGKLSKRSAPLSQWVGAPLMDLTSLLMFSLLMLLIWSLGVQSSAPMCVSVPISIHRQMKVLW